jgi:hypothetical protein
VKVFLIIAGTWLLSDAIYSYSLYLDRIGTDGKRIQNWRRDHWVRAVRAILAIWIIVVGAVL